MLDIDDFKALNDEYGHNAGDNALKSLAKYLNEDVRCLDSSEAGRWGGEEFMIILKGYEDNEVLNLAEKIRRDLNLIPSPSGNFSVSIGVTRHDNEETVLATIDRVDSLLYAAKDSGKNKVCSDL